MAEHDPAPRIPRDSLNSRTRNPAAPRVRARFGFRPVLLCAVLLGTACPSAPKPTPATPTPSPTAEPRLLPDCTPLDLIPLDTEDIRTRCPLTGGQVLRFDTEQAWNDWLATCFQPVTAPTIDWAKDAVLGIATDLSCPFQGSPVRLGAADCAGTLTHLLWTFPDHCYCDYFTLDLVMFAVPRAAPYVSIRTELVLEASCEQTTCLCDDETTTLGCNPMGCLVTEGYDPPVDGFPPRWP